MKITPSHHLLSGISALVLAFAPVAKAAVITLQQGLNPTGSYAGGASTYIRNGSSATTNFNGNSNNILTGNVPGSAAGPTTRGAFSFDLSVIPTGATINSVSFSLTTYHSDVTSANAAVQLDLLQLTTAFTESGVTWNTYNGTNSWTTPGGDFNPTPLSTISLNPVTVVDNTTVSTFASSASFVSLLQSSLNASQPLELMLKLDNEATVARTVFFFVDDENSSGSGGGNPATRPYLTIDYTVVPEPSVMALMVAGGGCLVVGARRFRNRLVA